MGFFNKSASSTSTAYNTDNSNVAAQDEGLAIKAGGNVIIDSEKSVAAAFEFGGLAFSKALDSVGDAYEASTAANSKISSSAIEGVKSAFSTSTDKSEPINKNLVLGVLVVGVGAFIFMRKK